MSNVTFGDILRRLRLDANLTQSAVAKRMGVDAATVSRIEKNPDLPKRSRAEAYLHLGLAFSRKQADHYLRIYDEMQTKPQPIYEVAERQVAKSNAYLTCLRRIEAKAFDMGFSLVGTPHILLDLYFVEQKLALHLYDRANVDLQPIVSKIEKRLSRAPQNGAGRKGYTLEAMQTKALAEEFAQRERTAVLPKHLWQALFAQEHTLLAQLLEQEGYSLTQVQKVLNQLH